MPGCKGSLCDYTYTLEIRHSHLGGRFGYFLFFLLGEGEGGVRGVGRDGGGRFLLKSQEGGGGVLLEGEGPRGREGVCGGLGNLEGGC